MERIWLHRFAEKLHLLGYSKRSIREYGFCLQWFLRYMEAHESVTDIRAITPPHLTAYHTHLQYEKRKNGCYLNANSIRQRLNAVSAFLSIFHDEGLLPENLSHHIVPPKSRRHLPKHVPSVKDMSRLLEAATADNPMGVRDRCILELLYATGVRAQELLTLTTDSVNLSDRTLLVHGKGAKDRIVPVGRWVIPWIIEYMEAVRPTFLRVNCPTDILFITKRGHPLYESDLCHVVRRYLLKAGLPDRITPHSLRHACATHLLEGGADIRYIQELLGHEDLSTTQIYTRVDISTLRKAHEKYHPRERLDNME